MEVTRYYIEANINKPCKMAFVSDLHDCDNDPIIEIIKREDVDAVLVGGDFIHNTNVYETGIAFLTFSSEICPTFCSLGNHEKKFNGDLLSLIIHSGAIPLDNGAVQFGEINIGGLSSCLRSKVEQENMNKTPKPDLRWLDEFSRLKGYKLLLSHHPEYYDEYIKPRTIDLTLSGHAHGGQWRFFGHGLFAPGQGIFPKYTSGMYDNRLIVSRGLGNPYSVPRLFNKPEIVILNLR